MLWVSQPRENCSSGASCSDMVIQILIIAFAAFAFVRTVGKFRAGELTRTALLLWGAFWVAVTVVTLLPDVTTWFARLIGVGRGVDAVIYFAIIFLYYFVFRIFLRLEKLDHDITLLVRKVSVPKDDSNDRKSDG